MSSSSCQNTKYLCKPHVFQVWLDEIWSTESLVACTNSMWKKASAILTTQTLAELESTCCYTTEAHLLPYRQSELPALCTIAPLMNSYDKKHCQMMHLNITLIVSCKRILNWLLPWCKSQYHLAHG